MLPALLVRFHPTGPWRFGPDSGARNRVDPVCHSDTFYSAVTSALAQLGPLESWLEATAGQAAVRLSSLFPWQGDTLFVPAPRGLWPPAVSSRVRWGGARFIPNRVMELLLAGKTIEEDRWVVDGPSGCLVAAGGRYRGAGPFRESLRSAAAVDRWNAGVAPRVTACLEFGEDAGMWGLAVFRDEETRQAWSPALRSALCLLADSGMGGERSLGWGRSDKPSFREGKVSELLFRFPGEHKEPPNARWLLSLYRPAPADAVDWSLGNYSIVTRSGRVWSPAGSGQQKRSVRMVTEGSVLVCSGELAGAACDVAPEGFPHAVYSAGFAVSLPVNWKRPLPATLPPLDQAAAPPVEPKPVVSEPEPEPPPEKEPPAETEPPAAEQAPTETEPAPETVPEVESAPSQQEPPTEPAPDAASAMESEPQPHLEQQLDPDAKPEPALGQAVSAESGEGEQAPPKEVEP